MPPPIPVTSRNMSVTQFLSKPQTSTKTRTQRNWTPLHSNIARLIARQVQQKTLLFQRARNCSSTEGASPLDMRVVTFELSCPIAVEDGHASLLRASASGSSWLGKVILSHRIGFSTRKIQ